MNDLLSVLTKDVINITPVLHCPSSPACKPWPLPVTEVHLPPVHVHEHPGGHHAATEGPLPRPRPALDPDRAVGGSPSPGRHRHRGHL